MYIIRFIRVPCTPVSIHYCVFLYKTTRNACLDYLRHKEVEVKAQIELSHLGKSEKPLQAENDDIQYKAELLHAIKEEIKNLPKRRRLIFKKWMKGMQVPEIARELNCTEKTIRNQKTQAVKQIRIALKLGIWVLYCVCYAMG